MALDQFIAALTVAVPVAKAMPMVGQYLEGGFTAVLEICKMAQGTRSLKGECEALAERASYLAVCIALRIDQANTESFSELRENVGRFAGVLEEVQWSLSELLEEKNSKSRGRQMLEWTQNKERIQQLSSKLNERVVGFTLQAHLHSHLILEQLNGTAALLRAASLRLEEGQQALLKGQRQLDAAREQDTRIILQELAHIRGTTSAMPGYVDNATLKLLDPELSACYDGAERLPEYTRSTIRGSEATCAPGTREQLLSDMLEWVNSPQPGLFWLSGLAGTGKTTIALTISKQLRERGQLLASFFILRDVKRRSRALSIVATISYQIAQYDANLRESICHVLRDSPDILSKSLDRQVDAFIKGPLSSSAFASATPCVIVIDALDECDKDLNVGGGDLIPLLVQVLPSTVKIIVTGRPDPGIESMMSRLGPRFVKLHDMDTDVVQGDIRRYLQYHLARLAGGEAALPWPSDADLTELTRRCGLLFVYAAAIVRYLSIRGFAPQERLITILNSNSALPGDTPYRYLDQDIYANILKAAVLDGTTIHPTLVERFQLLVGTIVLAQDPLPIPSLASFARLEPSSVRGYLQQLSSLLLIPDVEGGVVRVFHLSFADFVTDKARCPNKNFYVAATTHHTRLALRCLELMNNYLIRDICGIGDPSLLNDEVHDLENRLAAHVPPELAYACRHWMTHLQLADQVNPGLASELSRFIKSKLLYWIEVMSLLRELLGALDQLSRAQRLCQSIKTLKEEHKSLLGNCERLVHEFYDPIKAAALHTYYSALSFAPRCLLVDRTKDVEASVRMISGRHEGWTALLRTIEGHDDGVLSVAFSPDGKHIVSGSSDRTVRVWESHTGEHTNTLLGHTDEVNSVAFSPDGLSIISGSDDCTVRVWDAQTCNNTMTLEGHTGAVRSVALSPDGLCIISGSGDRTVRVWDAQTGNNTMTLLGHTAAILSVACSPDGLHIASCSSSLVHVWDAQTDKNIKTFSGRSCVAFSPDGRYIAFSSNNRGNTVRVHVWDMQSGKITKALKGHINNLCSVAFSPDGLHIVSGSMDNTMRVWDIQTGKDTNALKGYSLRVQSIAFSPDGWRIVSGSHDGMVCVWDTQAGKNTQNLKAHTAYIRSVAFSPDGLRIVSGSHDNTACVWDTQTSNTKTLKGHSDWVCSLAFSPDGLRIASGSHDCTVRVWDTQTGENTNTLKGHTDWTRSLTFSPDGLHIVSGSDDRTVRVWDTQTGENIKALEGHTAAVSSVAFSPDSLFIVSGSRDHTLRVWDPQTGKVINTLEGHTNWVLSVAFSLDALHVVSRSDDGTLRIWDVQTAVNTRTFDNFTLLPRSVVFSPHGQHIASQHIEGSEAVIPLAMSMYTVDKTGWVIYSADLGETPRRRCWLPRDRRPAKPTHIVWQQDVLAISGEDGIITIIRFSA